MDTKLTGRFGERYAADCLKKKKYRIVGMNYSCRFGEIDIIAENRQYIVFVEVKLRKDARFAAAREFVTAAKQDRIRKTALLWLSQNPSEKQPRFDVIELYAPEGERSENIRINHIENAFE
ncbi:MAG: YraN family protein [Oscillospiraceae bacterium]|jgi:putative endonuclease